MAKGYPDYFGQSVWPKHGSMRTDDELVGVIAGLDTETILLATGLGVLHGATIFINSTVLPAGIEFILTVDGIIVYQNFLLRIFQYFRDTPADIIISCTEYDIENGSYSVVINGGISFISSFRVQIHNWGGANINDTAEIYYYHVT